MCWVVWCVVEERSCWWRCSLLHTQVIPSCHGPLYWVGQRQGGIDCMHTYLYAIMHLSSTFKVFGCSYLIYIYRSTFPSRPNKVGLKCPSACPYVRPSTKSFFGFNVIWYVGRGWWVMHDSMQNDPIQGQGHEPLKVGNSAIFKGYLLPHL